MKRDDLIAMGLEEEQAVRVMESLNGNYVTKSRFNEVNGKYKSLKANRAEGKEQLEKLNELVNENVDLKKQIEKLLSERTEMQQKQETILRQLKIRMLVEQMILDEGERKWQAIKTLFNPNEGIHWEESSSSVPLQERIAAYWKGVI